MSTSRAETDSKSLDVQNEAPSYRYPPPSAVTVFLPVYCYPEENSSRQIRFAETEEDEAEPVTLSEIAHKDGSPLHWTPDTVITAKDSKYFGYSAREQLKAQKALKKGTWYVSSVPPYDSRISASGIQSHPISSESNSTYQQHKPDAVKRRTLGESLNHMWPVNFSLTNPMEDPTIETSKSSKKGILRNTLNLEKLGAQLERDPNEEEKKKEKGDKKKRKRKKKKATTMTTTTTTRRTEVTKGKGKANVDTEGQEGDD